MVDIQEFIRESNAIENVYDDAAVGSSLNAWEYLLEQEETTHDVVKGAHRRIMEDRQPDIAGEYRTVGVRVGDDIPPKPAVVPDEMDTLLAEEPSDPVEALVWHVDFERVHPFADGNGRVGRLLYAWHCYRMGETPIMWRADDVDGYYSLFASK